MSFANAHRMHCWAIHEGGIQGQQGKAVCEGVKHLVGRDSIEPTFERSEASHASFSVSAPLSKDTRVARASFVGNLGSTECRPTIHSRPWLSVAPRPDFPTGWPHR